MSYDEELKLEDALIQQTESLHIRRINNNIKLNVFIEYKNNPKKLDEEINKLNKENEAIINELNSLFNYYNAASFNIRKYETLIQDFLKKSKE